MSQPITMEIVLDYKLLTSLFNSLGDICGNYTLNAKLNICLIKESLLFA